MKNNNIRKRIKRQFDTKFMLRNSLRLVSYQFQDISLNQIAHMEDYDKIWFRMAISAKDQMTNIKDEIKLNFRRNNEK